MIVLDASVVIAFLDPADVHHAQASALLDNHAADGFWMHELTLAEVLVGAVRVGRASQLRDELNSIGIQTHPSTMQGPLILAELRATIGLKMPDCCVLSVAQHHQSPLATFDERLMRVANSLGLSVLP